LATWEAIPELVMIAVFGHRVFVALPGVWLRMGFSLGVEPEGGSKALRKRSGPMVPARVWWSFLKETVHQLVEGSLGWISSDQDMETVLIWRPQGGAEAGK
jgi:hypothetical protein